MTHWKWTALVGLSFSVGCGGGGDAARITTVGEDTTEDTDDTDTTDSGDQGEGEEGSSSGDEESEGLDTNLHGEEGYHMGGAGALTE